jgi:hypothetical protein
VVGDLLSDDSDLGRLGEAVIGLLTSLLYGGGHNEDSKDEIIRGFNFDPEVEESLFLLDERSNSFSG